MSQGTVFNRLLAHPELLFEFTKHLHHEDLISLYAISKHFHLAINRRFTSVIYSQVRGKAFESSTIFSHQCYKELCIRDPAARPNAVRPGEVRWVPSFRWLRMILWRETIVDDIIASMTSKGIHVRPCTSLVLKKLWFTIDVSDNTRRIGLMHNIKFWRDNDLYATTQFFLKLDLCLTCPVTGNGEIGLRRMLLNQRSLSTLATVLTRDTMSNQLEMLRMLVHYSYKPHIQRSQTILGIPANEVGCLQYEGWGLSTTKFIPVDGLIMREAIRRRLNLELYYVDMILEGQ